MKKHFFNVIATLALVCGVFAFSGCTDFEKDINDLNNRLDALETGKIADLESQVASLKDALNAANDAIDALEAFDIQGMKDQLAALQATVDAIDLSKYVTVDDFNALEDKLDALKAIVDAIDLDKYATLDYVDGTFATKEDVEELNTALGALEGSLEALQGKVASLESAIEALDDRVEGLENLFDVDDVKISDILNKIDKAQADASSALGQIKSLQDALGIYAEAGAIQDALDLKMDIADFNDAFNEALKAALDNGGEISTAIANAINEAVAKLEALFANRLTSISLIPSAYLDGVPAIKFYSYLYTIKTVNPSSETVTSGESVRISAEATDVDYHISPSLITKEDINTPSYLIQEAELITRAGADEIELNVIDYDIESDVLTVSVRRDAGISLNHDAEDYIYTAALKVPIAEKNLVEGETEANVYSEYAALYEDEVTPYIAAVIDESKDQKSYNCTLEANHFYATYAEAAEEASDIARTGAYNEAIDLLAMVTGCEGDITDIDAVHKEITKTTLKANGLAFRFAVPTKPFLLGENNTDQQKFAYVEGNTLKSTYVNAPEGAEPNQASIDKTPVVRVELVDTVNSQIVDVRYFKIKWTPVPFVPEDEDLGLIFTFTDTLGCAEFDADITWDIFVEKVLSKVNDGQGLSYNEFLKIYKSADAKVKVDYPIAIGHDNTMTVTWDDNLPTYDEHAAAFHWNILPSEYGSLIDGKTVEEIEENQLLKTFTATVELPSNDDYNGTITFQVAVNVVAPELPSLVGLDLPYWNEDGELARIRPVQYGSEGAVDYVTYNYDLTALFRTNEAGVIIDGVVPPVPEDEALKCRAWSIQFARDQKTSYVPGFNYPAHSAFLYASEDMDNGLGYELFGIGERAVYMTYNDNAGAAENAVENWHQDVHNSVSLALTGTQWTEVGSGHYRGTDAAIALLESIDTPVDQYKNRITINAWGRINPWNHVIVKTFDVVFIKPLDIEAKEHSQCFEDGFEGGRYVDVEQLFSAVDSWKYPVNVYEVPDATGDVLKANERRKYYDVQMPKFDLTNARIGMYLNADGNYAPCEGEVAEDQISTLPLLSEYDMSASVTEANMDDDAVLELVFKAEHGWNLEKVVNIYIEVSIDHKWGTESMWVTIPVYPHGEVPSQN